MPQIRFPLLLLLLAGMAGSLSARDKDAGKELEMLQGSWKVLRAEKEGNASPAASSKDMKVVIADNKMSIMTGKMIETSQITLDPSKMPATIEFQPLEAKEVRVHGIYKLDKDVLTICFTLDGKKEPPKSSLPSRVQRRACLCFNVKRSNSPERRDEG